MLVLTRNIDETIIINGDIEVTVADIQGGQVRLVKCRGSGLTFDTHMKKVQRVRPYI